MRLGAAVLGLALLAGGGLFYASTHPPRLEFEDYLDKDSESYRLLALFRRQIHKDMNVAVRLEGADVLDPALWTDLANLEAELGRDGEVGGVESALDLPLLDVDAGQPRLASLASRLAPPASRATTAPAAPSLTRDLLRRTFEVHPFLVPYYLDPGRAIAFYVAVRGSLDEPRALEGVVDRVADRCRRFAADRRLDAVLGGFPYLHTRLQRLTDENQARTQVRLVLAMALATTLFVAGWRSRLVVMLGALAAMAASNLVFPLANLAGFAVRPGLLSAMIPTLVMILAVSQLVQLQRMKWASDKEAAAAAIARLRAPVLGSALTNAMGFFVLATFRSPPIHDFGILAGVAILLELGCFLAVAPALARVVAPVEPPLERDPGRAFPGWLPARVHAAGPRVALFLGAALGVAAVGLTRLEVRYDPRAAISPDHPLAGEIARGQELIGGNDLQVFVRRTDGRKILTAQGLEVLDRFETRLAALAGVRVKISMLDYFKTLNYALNGRDRRFLAAPSPRDFARSMVLLPDDALLPFWLPQENLIRILVRLDRLDTRALESFEAGLDRILPPAPFGVTVTGSEALYYRLAFELPRELTRALLLLLAALWVMFLVLERSPVRACLFLSPVAASLIAVYGAMGLAGIPLMVATAMIATVSSGLVVDTAYYLAHGYRPGDDLALRYARFGPGALVAGSVVTMGFLTLLGSDFLYIRDFGVFLGLGLAAGLTMHMLFLPIVLLDQQRPARLSLELALLFGPALAVLLLAGRGTPAAAKATGPGAEAASPPVARPSEGSTHATPQSDAQPINVPAGSDPSGAPWSASPTRR